VMRAMAVGARGGRGRLTLPPPRDYVVEAAERLHGELAAVADLLAAPSTSVRLILTPEAVVLAEARRAWTSLALYGYVVDAVVANRLVPGGGADPWRSAWADAQAVKLAEVEASFAPVPVQRAGYAPAEPVGATALAALGEELYGPASGDGARRLLAPPDTVRPLQVRRDGEEFLLRLELPLARRTDLELTRVGDDLRVRVGDYRRVLALPSGLRRCDIIAAALRDGALQVRFRPDPALWRAP
jgi:arsenite-transporting ATPase